MKNNAGFISLAAAAFLTIAGSLTYTAIELLNNQNKVNSIHNQIIQLNESESALNSFIKLSGRLPCPSKTRGGKEDCSPQNQKGWLPTQTLNDNQIITDKIYNDISNVRYLVYRNIETPSSPIHFSVDAVAMVDYLASIENFPFKDKLQYIKSYANRIPKTEINLDLDFFKTYLMLSKQFGVDFASLIKNSSPDLAINSDIYKPYISSKSIIDTVKSEIISPNDFCQKLINIKGLINLEQANIPLSENITSNRINIAYAIAASNGNEFSPINANNNPEMESPSRKQNGLYTDSVRAVGALSLMNSLGCENNLLAMDALQIANKEIQTQLERKTLIKAHLQWGLLWENDFLNLTIASLPHDVLVLINEIPADISLSLGRVESDARSCAFLFFISACISIAPEIIITSNKVVQVGSEVAALAYGTYKLIYQITNIVLEQELLEKLEKFTLWDERAAMIYNTDLLGPLFKINEKLKNETSLQ